MRALVTGASRGIGKAIATALAAAGMEVIGTAREPGAGQVPGVRYLPLDLRDGRSIEACVSAAGPLDILVNNAGVSAVGALEELPPDRLRALFETNLFGTLRLTQLILPVMRARHAGRVVTIVSFAALSTVPFFSAYAASKAALVAAFRGLRLEAASWGIAVSVVAPMETRTSMKPEVCYDERSPYFSAVKRVHANRDRLLSEGPDPALVARVVLRTLQARRPRFFQVAGRDARLTTFLVRHAPERIVEAGVRKRSGLGQ